MTKVTEPILKWLHLNEISGSPEDMVTALGLEVTIGSAVYRNAVAFTEPPTPADLRDAKDALEGWAERKYKFWLLVEHAKGDTTH